MGERDREEGKEGRDGKGDKRGGWGWECEGEE